jgi:hypothetical protein
MMKIAGSGARAGSSSTCQRHGSRSAPGSAPQCPVSETLHSTQPFISKIIKTELVRQHRYSRDQISKYSTQQSHSRTKHQKNTEFVKKFSQQSRTAFAKNGWKCAQKINLGSVFFTVAFSLARSRWFVKCGRPGDAEETWLAAEAPLWAVGGPPVQDPINRLYNNGGQYWKSLCMGYGEVWAHVSDRYFFYLDLY